MATISLKRASYQPSVTGCRPRLPVATDHQIEQLRLIELSASRACTATTHAALQLRIDTLRRALKASRL